MYRLHYVRGINTYDTLQFDSLSDQEDFFDDCVVGQPVDEYYPPLYKNKIKFAFDNSSINSLQANYLSLTYKEKNYYYFIDRINYISEDLFEFEITMDTIQTYMFDIQKRGRVSRKSIARWSGNNINRNYVRENISEGSMNFYAGGVISTDFIYAIAQFAEYHGPNASNVVSIDFRKSSNNVNRKVPNGMIYFIMPIPITDTYIYSRNYKLFNDTVSVAGRAFIDALQAMISQPYCLSLQLIPSKYLDTAITKTLGANDTLEFSDNTNGVEFNNGAPFFQYEDGSGTTRTLPFMNISVMPLNFYSMTPTFSIPRFYKNDSISNSFYWQYVPFLLDENYINFDFGEKVKQTTYPLHEIQNALNNVYINFYYKYDLESGFRTYKIYGIDDTFDKYITTINIATQPTMILNKDSWEQYYAYNKANYTIGISRDMANMVWSGVSGTSMQAGKTAITGQTLRNNGLTQIWNGIDTENPQGISSGANTMNTGHMWSSYGKAQAKVGIANMAIQMANYSTELVMTKENAGNAPNDITGGNNPINDYANDTFLPMIRYYRVTDYEAVARKVEYYGYPVDEYYVQTGNPAFRDFKIRYYYNVVQMDALEIAENIIIPNDLKADFIARLKSGIRLWTIHNSSEYIGYGLTRDNVEIANISN